MNLLLTQDGPTTRHYPCPNCGTTTPMRVVRSIETPELLEQFFQDSLNRAACCSCGTSFEAPVILRVSVPDIPLPPLEAIPFDRIDDPEILDHLAKPAGEYHRVYSLDELLRRIIASAYLAIHQGLIPSDFAARIRS
jgi:hypothetical protein